MITEHEIFNAIPGTSLDEIVEVFVFQAERENLNFNLRGLLRRNGKIISPKPFSTDRSYLGILLDKLKDRKIEFQITYDAYRNLCYTVNCGNSISYSSQSLEEAICKSCSAYVLSTRNRIQ